MLNTDYSLSNLSIKVVPKTHIPQGTAASSEGILEGHEDASVLLQLPSGGQRAPSRTARSNLRIRLI